MADNNQDGVSPVAGRKLWSRRRKLLVGTMGAGAAVGFLWLVSLPTIHPHADVQTNADKAGEIGDDWHGIPRATPVAQRVAVTASQAPALPDNVAPVEEDAPISRTPIVAFQAGPSHSQSDRTAGGGSEEAARTTYSSMPHGTATASSGGSSAFSDDASVGRMLPDRNLFITMGTPMLCTPEQPINTDIPGPFRCKIKDPVRSTSSNVPLFDSGTWIVGEVAQSLGRGKKRAYAVMHRAETPQGCLVNFHNPVGDALGESGLDGDIDTHFFERFKGYAMIALLDALSQGAALAASSALTSRNGNSVNFNQIQGVGSQLGQGSYGDDINIPPTLRRNQALPIVVIATSDIDLRPCYNLVAR